jgi:hypothetical protein
MAELIDEEAELATIFISGHLSLTEDEFGKHYRNQIDQAIERGDSFVVGDARGADFLAQEYLLGKTEMVTVFHMLEKPRHNAGFVTIGGFLTDQERDEQMTANSDSDLAWVRLGREKSGTANNLRRRALRKDN